MCSVLCFTVCFIVYVPFLHRQCSVNVVAGESEDDRMMTTGLHTVRDIFCVACGAILGWKYVSAFEKDQRYKEGKFILERCKIHSGGGGPPDRIQLWAEHDARISSSEDDDQGAV